MKTTIKAIVILAIFITIGYQVFKWTFMRHYVGPNEVLVVVNKFGKTLPADRITVGPENKGCKGIQQDVFGPGRYFFNPIEYECQIKRITTINAGNPEKWDWNSSGALINPKSAPEIGLVTLKEGKETPAGMEVVDEGYKGLQKKILTPGTYKLNPYRYEIQILPAWVVPPGSVGVVTKRVEGEIVVFSQKIEKSATTKPDVATLAIGAQVRGILDDVLQPGVYYVNPKMAQLTIVPVGYDAISLTHRIANAPQSKKEKPQVDSNIVGNGISFYSSDGYQIEADLTVVWFRTPIDAPAIVRNIGNIDQVETNIIIPAMKAACQNQGAKHTAKELIQGATREKFQIDLKDSLESQVAPRSVHILLAMIRNITVKDNAGKDQTDGLITTIQRANIEIERQLTTRQQTETAVVKAQLEQTKKLVDVAKEMVASETELKVAQILADGQKKSAEIDAQRDLDVASINLEMAKLDAQRTEILGKADAQVVQLKNDANAKGAKLLVDALGSPAAYNKYIFAKNFKPTDLKIIFAGDGTFWTDLKTFQEIGAGEVIQKAQSGK